ncbi:MAG: RNA-binding protein [Pseudomonadota bacterium]
MSHRKGGKDRVEPERRCIVTGEVRAKEDLLRVVIGPDDTVVPDLEERLPGRGLWLCPSRDVVNTACAKNAFARAARQKVVVDPALADRIELLLVRKCIDLLSLARRAGQAVAGYEKVRARIDEGAVMILAARDGAADGKGKIAAKAYDLPVFSVLDAAEIGMAFGRDHAVHVAVSPGGLAERLGRSLQRLEGFRVA